MGDARARHTGRDGCAAMTDDELASALRSEDDAAYAEFIRRFQPGLAALARRLGVTGGERDVWVMEVLHDAALKLTHAPPPRRAPLAGYVAGALRNRVHAEHRESERRACRDERATYALDALGERAVLAACSEYSVRSSVGRVSEGAELSPALARLAVALEQTLSGDERRMLAWAASHVPHRQMAAWLGVSRAATSQRLWRLCRRLREEAHRYAANVRDERERVELTRFFQRAGGADGSEYVLAASAVRHEQFPRVAHGNGEGEGR